MLLRAHRQTNDFYGDAFSQPEASLQTTTAKAAATATATATATAQSPNIISNSSDAEPTHVKTSSLK